MTRPSSTTELAFVLVIATALIAAVAGCATQPAPTPEQCHIARMDVAAAAACSAETNCAAKWEHRAAYQIAVQDARDTLARCGK